MPNGFVVIDQETWEGSSVEQRALMTFKTLQSIDLRLQKLERRPLTDKCFSFLGGILGGFAAALGIKLGG